jgi:hypothetical protein
MNAEVHCRRQTLGEPVVSRMGEDLLLADSLNDAARGKTVDQALDAAGLHRMIEILKPDCDTGTNAKLEQPVGNTRDLTGARHRHPEQIRRPRLEPRPIKVCSTKALARAVIVPSPIEKITFGRGLVQTASKHSSVIGEFGSQRSVDALRRQGGERKPVLDTQPRQTAGEMRVMTRTLSEPAIEQDDPRLRIGTSGGWQSASPQCSICIIIL